MTEVRVGLAVTGPTWDDGDPLVVGLRGLGLDAVQVAWDDPRSDWASFDCVLVRSPTSYQERHGEFLAWADRAASSTELWNPVELLRWNIHRKYLLDLEARGVPVLPTVVLKSDSAATIAEVCSGRGWERVVLKPATSAGGLGVVVVDGGSTDGQDQLVMRLRFGDVVVQPYVDTIHSEGELRVGMILGEPVAAVRRLPVADDFGVQAHRMGPVEQLTPSEDAAAVAQAALRTLGRRTLHARVDLLLVDGEWRVVELQLIEPDRMLRDMPQTGASLLEALASVSRKA